MRRYVVGYWDLACYFARCFGLFHRWVQPECGRDGVGYPMPPCECPYRRVCVRCGAEKEVDG